MPRDLFGEVVRREVHVGDRRWYGLPLTVIAHALIIGVLVIAPLVATDVLPVLSAPATRWIVVEPPALPPAAPHVRRAEVNAPAVSPNAAPVDAPAGIAPDSGLVPEPDAGTGASVPGGLPGIVEGPGMTMQPEAPPAAPPSVAPVRITPDLRPPRKIKDVLPVYPDIAMRARMTGIVVLEATIGESGKVVGVRVLRSVPLLDQAAVDAVRQWEFTPTRLNGVAVPIVMTVTVNFTLR
jgi:protein TonB